MLCFGLTRRLTLGPSKYSPLPDGGREVEPQNSCFLCVCLLASTRGTFSIDSWYIK